MDVVYDTPIHSLNENLNGPFLPLSDVVNPTYMSAQEFAISTITAAKKEKKPIQESDGSLNENGCMRCMRSSPCASLFGLMLALIGGGMVCGGVVFGRKYLMDTLSATHIFPYVDFAMYGTVGAVVLFTLIAYLICALTSGWNRKHLFDGSRRTCCGRVCTMMFLLFYAFGIFLWVCAACLLAYPVVSILFLILRTTYLEIVPTSVKTHDLSHYGLFNATGTQGIDIAFSSFDVHYSNPLICFAVATGGAFFLVLGYLQMAICTAMNFVRLGDLRYYNINDLDGNPHVSEHGM